MFWLSWQILRRLRQPLPQRCRFFNRPQISEKCTKLAGNDWLALPRIVRLMWSIVCSLKFLTKCLKTASKLEGVLLWQWNLGKLKFVFVLTDFQISPHVFSTDFPLQDQTGLQWNLGKGLYFSWSTFQICVQLHHISVDNALVGLVFLIICETPIRFVWYEWCSSISLNIRSPGGLFVQSCAFIPRESLSYKIYHCTIYAIYNPYNHYYIGLDASR